MSSEGPVRYKVEWYDSAKEELREIVSMVKSRYPEYGIRLAQSIHKIEQALSLIPDEWGEEVDQLPEARFRIRIAFLDGIIVNYGFHEAEKAVIVRRIRLGKRFPIEA